MNSKTPKSRFLFVVSCLMTLLPTQYQYCDRLDIDAFLSQLKITENLGNKIHQLFSLFSVNYDFQNTHIICNKVFIQIDPVRFKQLFCSYPIK